MAVEDFMFALEGYTSVHQFAPSDEVSEQLGLIGRGDSWFHWAEDPYGNPVVPTTNSDGHLEFWYADWDEEKQQFNLQQYISPDEPEPLTERLYRSPSTQDCAVQITLAQERAMMEMDPLDRELIRARERMIAQNRAIKTSSDVRVAKDTLPIAGAPPAIINPPVVQASSGNLPSGMMQRNLLLIYVMFSDSTDLDKKIPEKTILKMFTDANTAGTFAHYMKAVCNGKVQLNILDNKVYYVTVPISKSQLGSTASHNSSKMPPIVDAALLEVLNQGFDLGAVLDTPHNRKSHAPFNCYTSSSGEDIWAVDSLYISDQVSCLPVFIIHGQDFASNGGTSNGYANDVGVWPHASVGSELMWNTGRNLIGVDWDGNPVKVMNTSKYDKTCPYATDPLPNTTTDPAEYYSNHPESLLYVQSISTPSCILSPGSLPSMIEKVIKPKLKYAFTNKHIALAAFSGKKKFADNMAVIAHEAGHALFSLPDYYDTFMTRQDTMSGVGTWSIMCDPHKMSDYPPIYDGYSLHIINPKFTVPITQSGDYMIESPYRPHIVICKDNPDECFILQPRAIAQSKVYDSDMKKAWKDYYTTWWGLYMRESDKALMSSQPTEPYRNISSYGFTFDSQAATNLKSGLLILHANLQQFTLGSDIYQVPALTQTAGFTFIGDYSDIHIVVMEAHGGTQHLILNHTGGKADLKYSSGYTLPYNYGLYDDGRKEDLFGELTQDKFGQTTDPSNAYWHQTGNAPFNITNIKVDKSGKCTYHIDFTGESADDPDWDSLPDDPQRPPSLFVLTPTDPPASSNDSTPATFVNAVCWRG